MRFFQAISTKVFQHSCWCYGPEKKLMILYLILSFCKGEKGQANHFLHYFSISIPMCTIHKGICNIRRKVIATCVCASSFVQEVLDFHQQQHQVIAFVNQYKRFNCEIYLIQYHHACNTSNSLRYDSKL